MHGELEQFSFRSDEAILNYMRKAFRAGARLPQDTKDGDVGQAFDEWLVKFFSGAKIS